MDDTQKNQIIARTIKYHAKGGRVYNAVLTTLNTTYPAGTILPLKFAEMMKDLPYGHVNMCMDKKTDCAEFWRIIYYIWFGIDLGNFSDAIYDNKLGVTITKDYRELGTKCRPLDLTFYHTNKSKKTGHVSGIFDATRQLMSGAAVNLGKVGFTGFLWHNGIFMCAKRYLSDEQIASVTVQGVTPAAPANPPISTAPVITPAAPTPPPMAAKYTRLLKIIRPRMKGNDVLAVQTKLKALGLYKDSLDGIYGPETYKAVLGYQKKNGLMADGEVGPKTWTKLLG